MRGEFEKADPIVHIPPYARGRQSVSRCRRFRTRSSISTRIAEAPRPAGGRIAAGSAEVRSIVGTWQQEARDLCLRLLRQTGVSVSQKTGQAAEAHERWHDCRVADAQCELAVYGDCTALAFGLGLSAQ